MTAVLAWAAGIFSGWLVVATLLAVAIARMIRIADDRMVTPGDVPSAERVSS